MRRVPDVLVQSRCVIDFIDYDTEKEWYKK